ncbi:hypothetical protein TrCOL_g9092 [Triparma columacea]|uniref:Uncharacterized protein n=1 Tax=Triparma columacea TaxID=722753 RepID=A0A9W7G7M9_9STRA|nr:hypothetical protein TrCOL_g9092 [Triparma columacea]
MLRKKRVFPPPLPGSITLSLTTEQPTSCHSTTMAEWEKGATLRNDFEKAILGNKMKEVLLESEKDCVGSMLVDDKLAEHLNKEFCQEVNATLLGQHGFRCEAKYWQEFHGQFGRQATAGDGPTEYFALAIYKNDGVGDSTPFLGAQMDNRRVAK